MKRRARIVSARVIESGASEIVRASVPAVRAPVSVLPLSPDELRLQMLESAGVGRERVRKLIAGVFDAVERALHAKTVKGGREITDNPAQIAAAALGADLLGLKASRTHQGSVNVNVHGDATLFQIASDDDFE